MILLNLVTGLTLVGLSFFISLIIWHLSQSGSSVLISTLLRLSETVKGGKIPVLAAVTVFSAVF
jgi:type III secretory pathway component EscV